MGREYLLLGEENVKLGASSRCRRHALGPTFFIRCTDFCIVGAMKTTLDLHDDLLARVKALAALEHKTRTKLVEEGLVLRLRRDKKPVASTLRDLPRSKRRGGLVGGIDGASNRSLLDAADK